MNRNHYFWNVTSRLTTRAHKAHMPTFQIEWYNRKVTKNTASGDYAAALQSVLYFRQLVVAAEAK